MGFQLVAVCLLIVFYGCYFAKMIRQQRKGIQTNQLGKGKGGLMGKIERGLKGVSLMVLIVEVISIVVDTTVFPLGIRCLGVAVATLGVLLFVVSMVTMRESWRAGVALEDQKELVTGGIYQISRNPAFLGFDLLYIGLCLMFFNGVLGAVSLLAVGCFHLQIVFVEEKFLAHCFGEDYLNYRKKVRRYFGRNKR